MVHGLISDVLRYFTSPDSPWRAQWEQAKGLFLSRVYEHEPEFIHAMGAEWFLFDYRLPTGRTPLEEYLATNPEDRSVAHLAKLRPLLTCRYSLFSVTAIKKGHGLRLREELGEAHTYEVREKTMTYGVKRGDLVPARLCHYEGEWVIVGGSSPRIDARQAATLTAILEKGGGPLTPKLIAEVVCPVSADAQRRQLMKSEKFSDPKFVPYADAKANLEPLLTRLRLDRLVDVDLIEDWYRATPHGEESWPAAAVLGLLDQDATRTDFSHLAQAVTAFGNAIPRADLKGRSPQEMAAEPHEPDIHCRHMLIGFSLIASEFGQAMDALHHQDPSSAANLFEACFSKLLAEAATLREPWRLFANYAVALHADGDFDLAEAMAEAALELNYNYEFGIEVAAKILAERKQLKIRHDRLGMAGERDTHPAFMYLGFLQDTGIDFSTPELTVTRRTIFKPGPAPKRARKKK